MRRLRLALLSLLVAVSASAQSVVQKGATDISRYIVLVDSSDGTPETSFTITGLDLQYTRDRSTPATKVDATALAATNTAHTDNRCIEIDSTSSPGLYRCDWPDAAFATGVDKVLLVVSGVGLHPAIEEIQLVDYDPEDGVRLGLTALPAADADAAGGLPISDAGGLDLDALESRLGTPSDLGSGATLAANLADIEGQTDDIGAAGAGLTEAGGTGDQLTAIPMTDIVKNAAFNDVPVLMVDATDGFTPETGLTLSCERSLDGGAFSAVSGSVAEISDGFYQFDAAAADTNGDVVIWRCSASGAADWSLSFRTK